MSSCYICGKERPIWEMHSYDSGLVKCKEHSVGFAITGKAEVKDES